MSLPINSEILKLAPDAIVAFYVLDATAIGGDFFRFYPGTKDLSQTVAWQGQDYTPYPMEVRGYAHSGQGAPPRPTLFMGNQLGVVSALVQGFDDLIGAKLTRKRTFAGYLDGMPGADPNAGFPDDVFFIERKVNETRDQVEFELATPMDVDAVSLPRRKVLANLCAWLYRGEGCHFAGDTAIADLNDTAPEMALTVRGQWNEATTYHQGDVVWIYAAPPVRRYYWCHAGAGVMGAAFSPSNPAYWTADQCSKRVSGCKLRFGNDPDGLPFGGFPAVARVNS